MNPLSSSNSLKNFRCVTTIFIFCLGVLSPWRIIPITQRNSCLRGRVTLGSTATNGFYHTRPHDTIHTFLPSHAPSPPLPPPQPIHIHAPTTFQQWGRCVDSHVGSRGGKPWYVFRSQLGRDHLPKGKQRSTQKRHSFPPPLLPSPFHQHLQLLCTTIGKVTQSTHHASCRRGILAQHVQLLDCQTKPIGCELRQM